ncbi:MAG: hypothetical protein AAGD05_11830, partial [Bacteroidota bacterium]
ILRNVALLIWRLLDFGRIAMLLTGLFLIGHWWSKINLPDRRLYWLSAIPLLLLGFQLPSLILIQNPLGHRYLLSVYLTLGLLIVYLLLHTDWPQKVVRFLLWGILLCQLTGHLWVYPPKVAQGWDSSLAHVPYFELRQQLIDYLDANQIPISTVGTEFPNNVSIDLVDLNGVKSRFPNKDLSRQSYIFYATVFNDFTDAELDELYQHWIKEKVWKKHQIEVILFRRPPAEKLPDHSETPSS